MNILENVELKYYKRYFTAISQLLFKPHQFYGETVQHLFKTPAKFYLLTHYAYFIISLPFLADILLRLRFFLRVHGYLNAANLFILNTENVILLNIFILPLMIMVIWIIISQYFKLLMRKYSPQFGQLYFTCLTAHTAAAYPAIFFFALFFLLDVLIPQNVFWVSFVFFGVPTVYLFSIYFTVRRSLRIKYKIGKIAIHIYMLSPVFIILIAIFVIYIYGVIIA